MNQLKADLPFTIIMGQQFFVSDKYSSMGLLPSCTCCVAGPTLAGAAHLLTLQDDPAHGVNA